jgi:hypothetical protein
MFIEPKVFSKKFTCPYCGTITQQDWWYIDWDSSTRHLREQNRIRVGKCINCEQYSLWVKENMVYPENANAPFPNPEMPEEVKRIYLEAASIHYKSPRGAAALLRLAIQVLCRELGEEGDNINNDIANLVKKGLPEIVQQSLDVVRVTGNNAVHPGQIDTDDPEVVSSLFELINIIIEYMIALPKKVSGLYSNLPASIQDNIKKRDNQNS